MSKEVKKFKTESKELLDLMINSIYSNKEIFLRELISNASDAIDKRRYASLNSKDGEEIFDKGEIWLIPDKEDKTITIKDNGIGMSHDELVNNIGTIAKSGSKEFVEKLKEAKNNEGVDIIGQFGVGFYSAFMVAKKIEIETKSKDNPAYRFTSNGTETYSLEEIEKDDIGTSIKLYLKDNTEDDNYSNYSEDYTIEYLVKKYSNYVRYPIKMNEKEKEPKKDEKGEEIKDEYNEVIVTKTLNSMIPLWKKNKKDVKEEELNEFYKSQFHDYLDPLDSISINVEGMLSYNSIVFIPSHIKNEIYNREDMGLSLYAKGVFIMEKCKDLLPRYLNFIEGVVDSADLNLNISREMLQENKNIFKIRNNVENKIISNLKDMKNNDFDKYLKFFKLFGSNIKYGIYENYGSKNELLQDLLIFKSLKSDDKYISLADYVKGMKEGQNDIYFASGSSIEEIKILPELERFKKEDIDVLFFDKDVDEFAIRALNEFDKHKFKSVSEFGKDDLSQEEKDKLDSLNAEHKRELDEIKEYLKDHISNVEFSTTLVDSPVSLSNSDGLSLNMEKILNRLQENQDNPDGYKSPKVLQLNAEHPLFKKYSSLTEDEDKKDLATLMYEEALILSGLDIDNKEEFTKLINKFLLK